MPQEKKPVENNARAVCKSSKTKSPTYIKPGVTEVYYFVAAMLRKRRIRLGFEENDNSS
jgi:hypothetical protein